MIPRARLKLQEQFEIVPGLDASTHRGGAFGRSAADGVTSVHRCTRGCAECSREDDVANELLVFERDPDNDLAHKADFVHHRGVVIREASLSLKSNSASPPGYLVDISRRSYWSVRRGCSGLLCVRGYSSADAKRPDCQMVASGRGGALLPPC